MPIRMRPRGGTPQPNATLILGYEESGGSKGFAGKWMVGYRALMRI